MGAVKKEIYLKNYFQNVCCHLERIASINAMKTVSIRHVTESTGVVCMVVKKGGNVTQVHTFCYADRQRTIIFITITAFQHYTIHSASNKSSKIFFTLYFLDSVKHINSVSSNNLPITIGSLMSACILIIIGVVITILVLR